MSVCREKKMKEREAEMRDWVSARESERLREELCGFPVAFQFLAPAPWVRLLPLPSWSVCEIPFCLMRQALFSPDWVSLSSSWTHRQIAFPCLPSMVGVGK